MTILVIPKETAHDERRVAATPLTVKEYVKKGFKVVVEKEAGALAYFSNEDYVHAGAIIEPITETLYRNANIILKVHEPTSHEIEMMHPHTVVISFFQTTKHIDLVRQYLNHQLTGFSMHLIPRTSLAQKMDALSSQSNIAGYKAAIIGADHISKYMPLLMTAAGTIPAARVLVVGAGVAGLQAIATTKRLGAHVEAFDVRPVVKEQVQSLGAKFIEVPSDDSEGIGDGGYAKETSDDYKQKQAALIKSHLSKTDLVITTALIPGLPAPKIITKDMVMGMQPGSVIVDLAAENGGNCELTQPNKIIKTENQVIIDGPINIPSTMSTHASFLYAKNVYAFVDYMTKEDGTLNLDFNNEIIGGAAFSHDGKCLDKRTQQALGSRTLIDGAS